MVYMSKIDYLDLDGNSLRAFLTVLEENSVSKAAIKLNVSQSAISHTLDKLRTAFDDPLFVRDGRGIVPTKKGELLQAPVTKVLSELKALTYKNEFNPFEKGLEFTVAANDFTVMYIFPKLLKQLYSEGINLNFNFIPSGVPSVNPLRARPSRCQLLITPAPPLGKDFVVKELVESEMVCFYDSEHRMPPKSREEYLDSQYVDVKFGEAESTMMILQPFDMTTLNAPIITVSNHGSLSSFIKGTSLISTQLSLLSDHLMSGLDFSPLPFETNSVKLYMVWHKHDQSDPAHAWLRQRIIDTFN